MARWIAVGALATCLLLPPATSRAQVAETLMKCTKSLAVAITCVVIEGGVAKAVDIGLDKLIALALGRKEKLDPSDTRKSNLKVAEIELTGIEWSKLKEALAAMFRSDADVNDAEAYAKINASCRANYQPICRYLGVPEPHMITDCAKYTSQQACEVTLLCSWKGSICTRSGGTRELLGR